VLRFVVNTQIVPSEPILVTLMMETILSSESSVLTRATLRHINAPWYVRNRDLHRDLGIETVTDIIAKFANSHEKRLQDHINIEASQREQYHQTTEAEETV
jgi:hypothetical protein